MFHPRVVGTYYEMGYQYGTILYKHGYRVPEQSKEKIDFGRKCEKEVKRVFPEVLEEIQGFADACHASYEQLAALILGVGCLDLPNFACSVFATFNGSDVMFGRNYDFYYRFKEYAESYMTCPKEGYWSIGHSDIFVGREDGVNEKGLAIAMTGVIGTIKPGINFPLAIRCILDKCARAEEAIKTLSDAHFSTLSNYLLTDRNSDMAVVEASPEKVSVRRPEGGDDFIVCTNHFVHPEMLEMENQKERCWDSVPDTQKSITHLNSRMEKSTQNPPRRFCQTTQGTCAPTRKTSSSALSGQSSPP